MGLVVQFPRPMQQAPDLRAALIAAAIALSWAFCGGRYDSPRCIRLAHRLVRMQPNAADLDAALAAFADGLATMTPAEWQGLGRQADQAEALRNRQRRAERARRRAGR